MTTGEEWRPVVGYESFYQVSDQGRVRSSKFGNMLYAPPNRDGYIRVKLSFNGSRKWFVHQLVLEAFVGPPPEGCECCHGPGGPGDNRLVNLRWDTRSANRGDCIRDGNDHMAKRDCCKNNHQFTPDNTYRRAGSGRGCRACNRDKANRHRQKLKAECR